MQQQKTLDGDDILFFSLNTALSLSRQIKSLKDVTVDVLLEIVIASLKLLITDEAASTSLPALPLPKNIATRHRVCTDIANRIKSLGFPGECGYNQLLYPTEVSTRLVLTWLVQKLPRPEEEKEQVLGSRQVLNKRVLNALSAWKEQPWKHPSCVKKFGKKQIRHSQSHLPFTTIEKYNELNTIQIFTMASDRGVNAENTIHEKHVLTMLRDGTLNSLSLLDGQFDNNDDDALNFLDASLNGKDRVKNAFQSAKAAYGQYSDAANNSLQDSLNNVMANVYDKSFNQLIQSIKANGFGFSPLTDDGNSNDAFSSNSRFAQATKFSQDASSAMVDESIALMGLNSLTEEAQRKENETLSDAQLIEQLTAEVDALSNDIDTKQRQLTALQQKEVLKNTIINETRKNIVELNGQSEQLESELRFKQSILALLPNADENIRKLQEVCASNSARLLQLAQEWETHRAPMINKIRALKHHQHTRKQRCKEMIEDIKKLKEEMQSMVTELRDKQAKAQLLNEEMDKLNKNINRSVYQQRILDIINTVASQRKEIERICGEIHKLQRSISQTTEMLQRADGVAEEIIYAAANNAATDKALVGAYKHLRDLRAAFDNLMSALDRLAATEKQSHDYETKIDLEKTRVAMNPLAQVTSDLEQVQQENAELIQQIKALSTR